MNNNDSISQRVKKIIDYYQSSITGFERKVGVGINTIGINIRRNANLSGELLNKIITVCPEISSEWLLTGKGPMLKEGYSIEQETVNAIVSEPSVQYKRITDTNLNASESPTIKNNNSMNQDTFNELLKAKDEALKLKDEIIKGKEEALQIKEDTIKSKEDTIKSKEDTIKSKEETIKELKERIKDKDKEIKELELALNQDLSAKNRNSLEFVKKNNK